MTTTTTTTTTTTAPIDAGTLAFCNAVVAAELTFVRGPAIDAATATPEEIAAAVDAYTATLGPLLDEAEATAPAAVAPDVVTVAGFVRASLASGEDLAANPDYRASDERVDVFVAGSCGYNTIAVSAVEYSFENLPTRLPAGRTTFAFTNNGAEIHEMVVFRINDGVTETIDELLALPEEEALSRIQFMGATFATQGETDTETLELAPGRYVALCFVPVGTTDAPTDTVPDTATDDTVTDDTVPDAATDTTVADDEGAEPPGPPHFTEGMQAEFTVT